MSQRHSPRRSSAILTAIAACLLTAGCQSQPAGAPVSPPAATAALEHCAANLHDLSGYLLQYFVVHTKLPATLEELRPLADLDRPLPLTCPVSDQPYIYVPDGLRSPADARWLFLYDTIPHNGLRNAIVGAEPQGNSPLGLWVIQLDQKAFTSFRPPTPLQPPTE